MPILAAFMLPHPPLIVPRIGKGSEREVIDTIRAYEEAASEIAALEPETIIITSPHSIMYSDYFHISPGDRARGSFVRFGAPEVRFDEEYDRELADKICLLADREDFPAGTEGERDPLLDHGCMVPLYFIRQQYRGGRIIRIGLSGLALTEHYHLGQLISEAVNDLGRRVVVVASGDLSHKLQSYGPYGYAAEGPAYDRRIMDVCGRAAFGELFDFDERFCEKAAECGHRSFVIMAGCFDGLEVKASALSHQDVTGVGYGICTFYPGAPSKERCFLAHYLDEQEDDCRRKAYMSDAYVQLARASVESWVRYRKRLAMPDGLPEEMTGKAAGTFVSIHEKGRLRGCIGTIMATRESIAEEIIDNAISASSRDPRFTPIEESELPFLEISVDVLGEIEDIDSPDELDVRRYGVIVSSGMKRGLLLPNLDGVDTVEDQISIARQKGGIHEYEDYKLQRFEVVRHY
ncbi:AmmeMemoRadiSam system protein A [Butyrivibrio sp. MC2013]|uniref:AmmeMemoRadiSam system protein A n=1 Tax=Butyrivibrio sp. MC2013 TaxID=1280686 RepID=UPI000407330B|nr:AmmeMemoRadiSam system protein A [Butyrivibrio sp. MC2013]